MPWLLEDSRRVHLQEVLMANAAALINEGLWRKDKEFQKLNRLAQCTFCQVLSMKDLDTAGVLTLHLELLAKACDELTIDQLRADFAALEDRRFLFVDYDTDEIFVRSYMRTVSVKNQNSWKSVPKNCRMVASEKIRHEMAVELRRLRRRDADDLAAEIDPVSTPSEPPPDPVVTTSGPGTPSRPGPDGDSLGLVPVLESRNAFGQVGVQRARPTCPDHETDSDDNCRPCMRRRMWDDEHRGAAAADELDRRRRQRDVAANCPRCHGTNVYELDDDQVAKCWPHLDATEAVHA